jgi:putative transposase
MKSYCLSFELTPIAYCLMPNHYHFLVRQDGEHPAGLLPQRVFNSYTKAFNERYQRSGTLFEGNYRLKMIQEESHLLHLCRYIHANPVKGGLVTDPADWPYSNYLEWVDDRRGTLADRVFVRAHFPSSHAYRAFVSDYTSDTQLPDQLRTHLNAWER